MGLNLIASPIVVHGLGLEAYGILLIVGVAINYAGVVELGLGRATAQFLGQHVARGEDADVREVLWTSVTAYLALSLAGAAALVALAPVLARRVLSVSPGLEPEAERAFMIAGAAVVVALQRNVVSAMATARERWDLVSRMILGMGLLQTLVTVSLVWAGSPVTGVILGGLAVQALAVALYWSIASRLAPGLWPPRWSLEKLRRLARFGGYVTVSQVVTPVLEHVEKVFIGAFAAVSLLPYYALPYSAAWALTMVPSSLASVIYPALVRLMASGDQAGVRETVRRSTRLILVALSGPVALLVIFAPEILTVWMGASFAQGGSTPLRILALAVLVNVLGWPSYQLLHAAGRADLPARFHVIELLVHVPVSLALIIRADVAGAALAWLLRVALDTGLMLRAGSRLAGLGARALAREAVSGGWAAAALLPLPLLARGWVGTGGRIETAAALAAVGVCYVVPVVWLGLGRDERTAVRGILRTLLARPGRIAPGER